MATTTGKHVILGGFGSLGRHLQRELVANGKSVLVLDRPTSNADDLLFTKHDVSFQPISLGDPAALDVLKGAFHGHKVETVYSLVTPDVQHGTVRDFERTNVLGVQQVIEACKEVGVPKLVFASSLAVMNHFVPHVNVNEEYPLPPMDSYQTSYDLTKRQGEDMVRAANDGNNFSTLSLRLGALLASYRDYSMRQAFHDGPKSGTLYTIDTAQFDFIAAGDVARAMAKADEKLSTTNSGLSGSALFCTKARGMDDAVPRHKEIATYLADKMGWKVQDIPSSVISIVKTATYMRHLITSPFQGEPKGIPPHLYLEIAFVEQTYDNSNVRNLLDWQPELSWQEALDRIIDEYKERNL